MNPPRRSLFTLCVCVQLFLSLPDSALGEKVKGQPCVRQLRPDVLVPALEDLSVCARLRLRHATRWTGFVYKAPGAADTELGFGGTREHMTATLFGQQWVFNKPTLHEWSSVCLTWSTEKRRFRVYINETLATEEFLKRSRPLTPMGALTLRVSRYVDAGGEVQPEDGSEIGLFRMWGTEWSAEELARRRCSDGDVVRWDERMWLNNCAAAPDLQCEPGKHPWPQGAKRSSRGARFVVGPDAFFRVNLTATVSGNPKNPQKVIPRWLNEKLESNKTMKVLNLLVKNDGRRYECAFHVQEYKVDPVDVVIAAIEAALREKHIDSDFIIETQEIVIKLITPDSCVEEKLSTLYGVYIWPETFPADTQEMGCMKPKSERAHRLCELNLETDGTRWAAPNMTACTALMEISDIKNVTVTTENAANVVDMIEGLVNGELEGSTQLDASDLDTVLEKLDQVMNVGTMESDLGGSIVNIISDILVSDTNVTSVAPHVLDMTENLGDCIEFPGESLSVSAPTLALSMVNTDREGFRGLTFGVSSISAALEPEVFVNPGVVHKPEADATICLPHELNNFFPSEEKNKIRVQFHFYGTPELFQDQTLTNSNWSINSNIVSASVNQTKVHDLDDKVIVTFRHLKTKQLQQRVKCVFWDFQTNEGQGGWSSRGCVTHSVSSNRTSCHCDHLTHFALLLDVSRTPISEKDSYILTIISYLGCGLSSIFLGITLVTYIGFQKLRRDYPSKILINLSAALLGLSLVFLLDSWLSSFSNYGLCIATAASLHYFLLASFTWMALEAVHMYLALVRVFNTYIPLYILKFCAVGWGLPLLIVVLVLAIDIDAYGSGVPQEATADLQSQDAFCWLQDDVFFYVTVVAFVLFVLLCNIAVFVMVLVQIRKMKANKSSTNSRTKLQDLRAMASITVLLGLTWSMGFLSFGPGRVVMMYLFAIFNTLQGFFVFLFHCLMKENVRKQWATHLCCGRLGDVEHSGWSRTVTVGSRTKMKNNLVSSGSVASIETSNTGISDSSSEPKQHKEA